MTNQKWIGVVAIVLATCCGSFSFPGQTRFGIPKPKQEQQTPIDFIAPEELKAKIANNEPVTIVDLRGANAYAQSEKTMVGAIHSKVRRVVHRLRSIPRDREVVTYCACPADEAAIIGARSLLANGFTRVRVLRGGWNAWVQAGGQLRPRRK
jgi:rhodanese-related sulfurtransferase